MKSGDSMFPDDRSGRVAHFIDEVSDGTVLTACGRYWRSEAMTHNQGRRKPCGNCAARLEARTMREETA